MTKPIIEYQFRLIEGVWRDVLGKDERVLADVLAEYEIQMDDRTQFARLYDYRRELGFYYRAFNYAKIILLIFRI